jgi:thioredoxin reductase (NADPH)
MHFAATCGELRHDQQNCGWDVDPSKPHDWDKMIQNVNTHIYKLNFGYFSELMKLGIDVKTSYASFPDPKNPHLVELTDSMGNKSTVTADKIILAMGNRPRYLNIENMKEVSISSDDLFWQKKAPGKTLVLGGGYVALECGGFIQGLGHEVEILYRSICLRGFDRDMVGKVVDYMKKQGTQFTVGVPTAFKKLSDGNIEVTVSVQNENGEQVEQTRTVQTVLAAVGRLPSISDMGLKELGINSDKNGYIIVNDKDQTSVDNIYAIGDIVHGNLELTPVAIKQGTYLANRLFGQSDRRVNLNFVATTIFTPLEYGCVGLSEETAVEKYTMDNLEVYHTLFKPLEWNFLESRDTTSCYAKVIVKKDDDKVLGLHIVSPHAGEVIQAYTAVVQFGLTYSQMKEMVAIHPTVAEELLLLNFTKRTNPGAEKGNC